MITLTPAAVESIRGQADGGEDEPVCLRVAARLEAGGEVAYGLGFDEPRAGDTEITAGGVVLLVAPASRELLEDVILDYREVEPGAFRFVFARASAP